MAEWVPIGDNGNGATIYVDPATIRKAGNKAKMWVMNDYETMQNNEVLSQKIQYEFDCQNETGAILAVLSFPGSMGSGQGRSSYKRSDSMPFSPGSVGDNYWKIACGK
jgi:hypothetical protein